MRVAVGLLEFDVAVVVDEDGFVAIEDGERFVVEFLELEMRASRVCLARAAVGVTRLTAAQSRSRSVRGKDDASSKAAMFESPRDSASKSRVRHADTRHFRFVARAKIAVARKRKKKGRRGAGVLVGPQAGRNPGRFRIGPTLKNGWELICWTPSQEHRGSMHPPAAARAAVPLFYRSRVKSTRRASRRSESSAIWDFRVQVVRSSGFARRGTIGRTCISENSWVAVRCKSFRGRL